MGKQFRTNNSPIFFYEPRLCFAKSLIQKFRFHKRKMKHAVHIAPTRTSAIDRNEKSCPYGGSLYHVIKKSKFNYCILNLNCSLMPSPDKRIRYIPEVREDEFTSISLFPSTAETFFSITTLPERSYTFSMHTCSFSQSKETLKRSCAGFGNVTRLRS